MEREARRKKIAARGTDRMALITGRIQNLDPIQMKSCSFSNPLQADQDNPVPAQHARSSSDPVGKEESLFQDYHHHHHGGDHVAEPQITQHDNNNEEVSRRNTVSEQQNLEKKEIATFQNEAQFPDQKPFEYHLSTISPKEINFSIISSENTRAVCSFVIAVLVVLSHVNLPHNVIKSKSLIAYRPLYAVLLTDMLIVAARLALFSQGRDQDEKEPNFDGDGDNWGGAVKLLEWGLVLHQTLRAIFIDCSFYLAIVMCGLSFV